MDSRENINLIYREKVEEIQGAFADYVKSLLASHFNFIINKYSNWKRYPRKVKKFLKKKRWWIIKDYPELLKSENFEVKFENKFDETELPTFTFENFKL